MHDVVAISGFKSSNGDLYNTSFHKQYANICIMFKYSTSEIHQVDIKILFRCCCTTMAAHAVHVSKQSTNANKEVTRTTLSHELNVQTQMKTVCLFQFSFEFLM